MPSTNNSPDDTVVLYAKDSSVLFVVTDESIYKMLGLFGTLTNYAYLEIDIVEEE